MSQIQDQFPAIRPLLPLLESCVAAYPSVLAGGASAAAVLFPGGSVELVRPVYGQSAVSRFYNERVAQAVLSLPAVTSAARCASWRSARAPARRPSRSSTRSLGRAWSASTWYTDLWDKLVNEARARLGPEYPNLRFAFLDVGLNPADQGFREEMDVVIATNVLHATRDLHATLRHTKKLLRPGGALVLNESVEVAGVLDLHIRPAARVVERVRCARAPARLAAGLGVALACALARRGLLQVRALVPRRRRPPRP